MSYPDSPGYQPHSDTSKAAAEGSKESSKRQAEDIFQWMAARGMTGATIDEGVLFLSARFGRDMQASPRFRQLELAGRIVKTSDKRETRTGHKAVVYRVAHIAPGDPAPPIPAPVVVATGTGHAMAIPAYQGNPSKPLGHIPLSAYDKARDQLARTGHGHIVARKDKTKARCGGPGLCRVCSTERAYLQNAKGAASE